MTRRTDPTRGEGGDGPRSPIRNEIGAVSIRMSDMGRAIERYGRLLGLPRREASHEGRIYDLPMRTGAGVILDGHRPVRNSSQPLPFFWTDDFQAAHAHLRETGAEIVHEVEDIGSVTTLTFRDPDGNLPMVCQAT